MRYEVVARRGVGEVPEPADAVLVARVLLLAVRAAELEAAAAALQEEALVPGLGLGLGLGSGFGFGFGFGLRVTGCLVVRVHERSHPPPRLLAHVGEVAGLGIERGVSSEALVVGGPG